MANFFLIQGDEVRRTHPDGDFKLDSGAVAAPTGLHSAVTSMSYTA